MNIINGAVRAITKTADATTAAAGAIGGAAVSGVVGAVQGAANGIKNGMNSGSHSTPAAAVTLAAIGATGVVDWPILLGIGGAALLVHQLNSRNAERSAPVVAAVPDTPPRAPAKRAPARKATKATKSAARTSTGRPRRSAAKR
jgi:hypothetical protein